MKFKTGFFGRRLVGEVTAFRLIAAIVTAVLLFVAVPTSIIAAANKKWFSNNRGKVFAQEISGAGAVGIIGEDKSKRGYNQKTFLLEDGTYLKQVYAGDVHYYDAGSRAFKEIDNTLDDDGGYYKNTSNSFKVSLAKEADADQLVSIEENGVSISMSLIKDAGRADEEYTKADKQSSLKRDFSIGNNAEENYNLATKIERENGVRFKNTLDKLGLFESLERVTAKADYEEINSGVNLEYTLSGRSLKENIVVTKRQSNYIYAFKITASGASLYLEDGDIAVYDLQGNKTFIIPKGYMTDAEGAYSDGVFYSLERLKEDYILTVAADEEWINSKNRAFPVTVDPTVQGITDYEYKTYWNSVDTRYEYDKLMARWDTQGINSRQYAMLRFHNSVFIGLNPNGILSASLTLTRKSFSHKKWTLFGGWKNNTGSFAVKNNYYTDNNWNNTANVLNFSTESTYSVSEASSNVNVLPVTQYARLAAQGQNYGIVLSTDEQSSTEKKIEYYAALTEGMTVTSLPTLSIIYSAYGGSYLVADDNAAELSPIDLAEQCYAGSGSVDFTTGILDFSASDIMYEIGSLPISIGRVYGKGTASGIGNNWRLNLSQTIAASGSVYVYTAADGKTYTIANNVNEALGVSLTVLSGSSGYILEDFNKNRLIFDANGKLTEINNGHIIGGVAAQRLTIAYSGGRIAEVTDSAGKTVYFNYSGSLLESIESAGGVTLIAYVYDALNNLIKAVAADGVFCQYDYDPQNRMIKATDSDFSYSAYGYGGTTSNTVTFVSEGKGDEVFSSKTIMVNLYSQTVQELAAIGPNTYSTVNTVYNIKRVVIREGGVDIEYRYIKPESEESYVLLSVYELDNTFEQDFSLKPINVTTSTQVSEPNLNEAYYITQNFEYEDDDPDIVYKNYFSSSIAPFLYNNGEYILGNHQTSYVPDRGIVQSSYFYAGLTREFYSKNVTLNSDTTDYEYYFTFWGKTTSGYCDINYGSFTETGSYVFLPTLSNSFTMGAMKLPLSNGASPKAVTIRAEYISNSLNQGSAGGTAQIDNFIISRVGAEQRLRELNDSALLMNDNPLIKKQYYLGAAGEVTYDTYHYADAAGRKLNEVKDASGNVKVKYYYNAYNYVDREAVYKNGVVYITQNIYDAKGFLTAERVYAANSDINNLSSAAYMQTLYEYDEYGMLIKVTDANGIETRYVLDEKHRVVTVQYDDGTELSTDYANDYGSVAKIKTGDIGNTYLYNTDGQLTSVYHNGMTTTLAYDSDSNLTGIAVGGNTLIGYDYDGQGRLIKETYGNGQIINYEYNSDGYLTKIYFGSTLKYSCEYDGDGRISKIIDSVNNKTTVYSETINSLDGSGYYYATGGSGAASHTDYVNSAGILAQSSDSIQGTASRVTDYSYNAYGELVSQTNAQGTYTYSYDSFGRPNGGTVNGFNQTAVYNGAQITQFTYSYLNQPRGAYGYIYDGIGNIIGVSENSVLRISYGYDGYGRLIRENNAYTGETSVYAYDAGGNIRKVTVYAYTISEIISNPAVKEIYYKYEGAWADQMTGYIVYYTAGPETYTFGNQEGFEVVYDNSGNPVSYRGHTLTWTMGRSLASYGSVSYKYNENGLRTQKISGSGTWKYFWYGDRLFAESSNGTQIWYYHNETGIQGMEYGGAQYYYMKNVFGDVIGIVDSSGSIVAKYSYTAWGLATVYDGSGNLDTTTTSIGYLNRIRYRSYYYDHESGLYYLQSRYYDPGTGRFISADSPEICIASQAYQTNGLNLYVYCLNNPVMYTDPAGCSPVWWNPLSWFDNVPIYGKILIGTVAFIGAVALTVATGGALAPMFITMGVGVASGALIGGFSAVIGSGVDWSQFGRGALNGFADGVLWGGIFALAGASIGAIKYALKGPQGALQGTTKMTLIAKGQKFDRFGSVYGKFITDFGTPISKLALPASNSGAKIALQATKSFRVFTGTIANNFGGTGGGVQYVTRYSIQTLIKKGWLIII